MKKINIDFQGGMHGHFLEYICNRFLAGIEIKEGLPFNDLGAAHNKTYLKSKLFECGHFSTDPAALTSDSVIAIKISYNDILAAQCVSLLRAGDYNMSPNELEINTYNKLNNRNYRWVLDNILEKYFQNQVIESYRAVMDPSWPMISSIKEYHALPATLREECENQHHLKLFELTEDRPDCPRHILREFFKFGFLDPEHHGFMLKQQKFVYDTGVSVYKFPFSSFYDKDRLQEQLALIADWSGYRVDYDHDEFVEVHKEFLRRQPYKDVRAKCDAILDRIQSMEPFVLPELNVIEEAYVESAIEKTYQIQIDPRLETWFTESSEIVALVGRDFLIRPFENLDRSNIHGLSKKIEAHYDLLFDTIMPWNLSPRYIFEHGLKLGMRDIFYYIDLLYENQPRSVIDVGCGECVWKNWFPNIVGFDPNTNPYSQQDFVDFFDEDFSRSNMRKFDCGMALNSLHFIPWQQIPHQLDLAMQMVRDRFLFTFNLHMFTDKPSQDLRLIPELKSMLDESKYKIVMFDSPCYRGYTWKQVKDSLGFINGTVRFILSHQATHDPDTSIPWP
jgi:hypothetical protein